MEVCQKKKQCFEDISLLIFIHSELLMKKKNTVDFLNAPVMQSFVGLKKKYFSLKNSTQLLKE